MKTKNIIEFIKKGNISIPVFLLNNYKKLKIDAEELILVIYLMNEKDEIIFDVAKIASNISEEIGKTLELINSLITKKIISLEIVKNKKGIAEEYLDLELFYNKLSSLMVEETKEDETDIYSFFEKELARPLSPIEYEMINSWMDDNHTDEMILQALKEAVLNNVHSFRYIDKILFDWKKKGYKKPSDIKKVKKMENVGTKEMFEYDWLDEDEK